MSRPKYIASCSGGKDSVATFCWLHSTMNRWMKPCSVRSCSPKTQAAKSRNTGTSSMTGSSPSAKRSWASSSPFFMQTRPTMTCSIMSSPADRTRVRFAGLRGWNVRSQSGLQNPARPQVQCHALAGHRELCRHSRRRTQTPCAFGRSEEGQSACQIRHDRSGCYKLCQDYGLLSPIYGHCRRNGCWFCPNASDSELLHMVTKHPDMFERLIEWENEDNIFHRRMTRRETPSEVKARLLSKSQTGFSSPKSK
mgnify:CR=1 FL=1